MVIKRINEFPDGSGSLTTDDIFLFMDDPDGSGVTKKISLNDISNVIGGSGSSSVEDILAGSGISISSSSGVYTITSTGSGIIADKASSIVTTVFNKTGSTIPKFRVVYINGGQGDMPTVTLAASTQESTSSKTYGITAESIDHMSTGKVIVDGSLTGLNTDQFNPTAPMGNVNGTILYLGTSSGLPTSTKPSAPNHLVAIGTIIRTHQNEGVVEVRIQNGFELEELHNVAISGITNHQILVYHTGINNLWQNTTLSSDYVSDFNSSVSGLLPVKNITPSGNIIVSSNNGIYNISSSGIIKSDITGITGASIITNIVQISQNDYDNLEITDPNTIYIINT